MGSRATPVLATPPPPPPHGQTQAGSSSFLLSPPPPRATDPWTQKMENQRGDFRFSVAQTIRDPEIIWRYWQQQLTTLLAKDVAGGETNRKTTTRTTKKEVSRERDRPVSPSPRPTRRSALRGPPPERREEEEICLDGRDSWHRGALDLLGRSFYGTLLLLVRVFADTPLVDLASLHTPS